VVEVISERVFHEQNSLHLYRQKNLFVNFLTLILVSFDIKIVRSVRTLQLGNANVFAFTFS
jgi:hypothetical protein